VFHQHVSDGPNILKPSSTAKTIRCGEIWYENHDDIAEIRQFLHGDEGFLELRRKNRRQISRIRLSEKTHASWVDKEACDAVCNF
jgi:hypothetical protein